MPRNKEKPGPEVGRRRKPGTTDKNPGLVPHADGVRMCLGLGSGRTELSDLQKFLEQSYETATVGRALRAPWIRNSGRSEHSISVFSDQLPKRPADRPRVILLTGMVGLDKSDYCDRLAALARRQFAQDVAVVHVGREMYSLGRDILPGRILRVPLSRLTELRNQVNERIREHLKAGRHVIVNTHATFWWHNGVFLAFDDDTVKFWREVQPDTVVELVDNIYTIHARLLEEHDYVPQLNEVAAWRVRETVAAQSMAVFLSGAGSHFLIGRGRNEKEEAQSINALCKRLLCAWHA